MLKFSPDLGRVKSALALIRKLDSSGLAAPTPVPTADGREYVENGGLWFYMARRVEGKPMTAKEFYEGDMAKARFAGEIIGRLHLALSRVDVPVDEADIAGAVKNWAIPRVRELMSLPEDFLRDYVSELEGLLAPLPRRIIHRDPKPGNIILSGERWGFVDFELFERNPRIYDPCYAATAVLSESFEKIGIEKWPEVYKNIIRGYDVRGYDGVVHLTWGERLAIPYVIVANQLICTAWFSEQEKYRELLDVNRRMTLWLVSVFDKLRLN